jgi:hypothetical protein
METFDYELSKFTDGGIKRFVQNCLEDFPDYFWTAPASGTGKFHDEEENGEGGLVVHTKRVLKVVDELGLFYALNYWEMDILYAASILHDSWSKGLMSDTDRTATDVFHPLYVQHRFPYLGYAAKYTDERTYDEIMLCVSSHSARWSVAKQLNVDKKLPNIFKLADYIASRKSIKVKL